MKEISRQRVKKALDNIIVNEDLANILTEGKKKANFLNAFQNMKYNGGSRLSAENALAWALGFTIIID